MNPCRHMRAVMAGALALLAPLCAPRDAGAQALPLDDKARYEKALEGKVDEVLLKLLGPNQAKVVIQATMDFTRTEKVDMIKNQPEGAEKKDEMFKWQSQGEGGGGQPFNEYLLPGFPTMAAESENQSYQKQVLFPASIVKKLTVTVIINKSITEADAQNMRSVVSELLGLDAKRGDEFSVIRTQFAPVWKTILNTPESASMVLKYAMLTVIGLMSLGVVGIGFLRLATAMNSMAKAQQSHITMDLAGGKGGPGAPGAAAGGGAAGAVAGVGGAGRLDLNVTEKKERHAPEMEAEKLFNVKMDQLDFLVNLLNGEDPANIALVAGHLAEDVQTEFLRMLPPDTSAEVMANMADMRYVDPEVVSAIRDEIEKQLAGAFGGINVVIDALEKVNLKAKREMISKLERTHPEVAGKVRRRVFLPEDLLKFSDRDVGILATVVKIEDWATALHDLGEEFKGRLKKCLTEKTWAMLEQTMLTGTPPPEKIEKAVETVVAAALKLISDGRVQDPLKAAPASPNAPVPAAPAAPGGAGFIPGIAPAGAGAPETQETTAGAQPQLPPQRG